ncbi:urea ABC transporter permease subunit UrtC, partial [Pseudomonas syringae pv. tagetis]
TWLWEIFVCFWQYFIGFLFLAVVLFVPTGVAGLLLRLSYKEVES